MTLNLSLTPELEQFLTHQASQRGLSVPEFTLQLLGQHVQPQDRRTEAVALLQSWLDSDDEPQQRAAGAYLVQALDEDRLSDRKLFPPELKGVSW